MTSPPRFPGLPALLRGNAPVLWSWLVAVGLTWSVQVGLGLGQPSQGLALSTAALPAALVSLAPPRIRRWAVLGTVTIVALLALANSVYHQAFGVYLPLSAFLGIGQGWRVRGYIPDLIGWPEWIPVGAILVTAGMVAAFRSRPPAPLPPRWSTLLPFAISALGSLPALGWAVFIAPGAADSATGGFLYAHLVDARRVVAEARMEGAASSEVRERVLRYTEGRAAEDPGADDPWFGRAAGSSVLLIQVEALNGWLVDADVRGQPVTPFLRSLARRGITFTEVFEETHEGRSSDADYLVMASQHPLARDAVSMVRPTLDPVALPDILRDHGYATFSAHAHIPGFWNAARRHERYGFQQSLFEADLGDGERLGFGLLDGVFFPRTLPSFEALEPPFLGWLITLTMHGPHPEVPVPLRTFDLGDLEGSSLGNYLLKARHTDDAIRDFLGALEARGILDRTTMVIYGDHTERHRFDMAWVRREAGVEDLDEEVQDVLLDRVPLLVVPPGPDVGVTVDKVGGLIDVAPTLLHLLGIPASRGFMGHSLLAEGPGWMGQASGEAIGRDVLWTGTRCAGFPSGTQRPETACSALREAAREELEISWLITRHGLGATLHAEPLPPR